MIVSDFFMMKSNYILTINASTHKLMNISLKVHDNNPSIWKSKVELNSGTEVQREILFKRYEKEEPKKIF